MILVAAAAIAGWLIGYNPLTGLVAAVAVLIVACPGALALATPAAIMAATGRLAQDRRARHQPGPPALVPGARVRVVHDAHLVLAAGGLDTGVALTPGPDPSPGAPVPTAPTPAPVAGNTCLATKAALPRSFTR